MTSSSKQEYIKRFVVFHLGVLKHWFKLRKLDENLIENANETHFIINYNNKKTLGFESGKHVKYVDVVSSGLRMTMVMKVIGG